MSNANVEPDVPRGTSTSAEVVAGIMAGWEHGQCHQCKAPFIYRGDVPPKLCSLCEEQGRRRGEIEVYAQRFLAQTDRLLPQWLRAVGMNAREVQADPKLITPPLREAISKAVGDRVETMVSGDMPARGFGFSGEVGRGKTFAIASLFKVMALARWHSWLPIEGRGGTRKWLSWVRWPEHATEMRIMAVGREGGYAAAEEAMRALAEAEALVLDDLGGERMKGDYNEDWTTSMLDLLVDRRHGAMRPTWYTTNLTRDEFVDRYGPRLFSRLCAENTMIAVPTGPDLRVVKQGG